MIEQMRKLLTGNELRHELTYLPPFNGNAFAPDDRLLCLNDLYDIYIPSEMSEQIYYKLYMGMRRSIEKKVSKEAVIQRNLNFRHVNNGVIGGSDSFSIIGTSGIGKSSAIGAALRVMESDRMLINTSPYMQVIPAIFVQCPFDCSVKSLLLSILSEIESCLGNPSIKVSSKLSTDTLIYLVSQACLNHVGILIVDEIQNVAGRKTGKLLIGSLMQLINSSGVSIAMVGTPEVLPFFEQQVQLARRSLGLTYEPCSYNSYFRKFCKLLYEYQYVSEKTEFDSSVSEWLYSHSGGIISVVVSLIHDAQEIAIISGYEKLDFTSLNKAYEKRMSMLHTYLEPKIKKPIPKKKKKDASIKSDKMVETEKSKLKPVEKIEQEYKQLTDELKANEPIEESIDIYRIVVEAKKRKADVLSCLSKTIQIERIKI